MDVKIAPDPLKVDASAVSGQITVANAGTAVQGTAGVVSANGFYIKAHPDNTDCVWFGGDGANSVTKNNGYPLNAGESVYVPAEKLSDLWFDAEVNGEKFCWLRVK